MLPKLKNPVVTAFVAQRVSGAILALFLLVHLITIIYAVQGELSVATITERVRGNTLWIVFYAAFILTAVVHSTIGIRKILSELLTVRKQVIELYVGLYTLGSLYLGYLALRAIW